ncbi:MAG TPA: FtsQ-type POTRA domain-containing protein [Candidatus Acidoferrales bacterium]
MAAEPELYQNDLLAEEEPRYLRRQKPVEIRRRKFGKRAGHVYLRWFLVLAAVAAVITAGVVFVRFLLNSPRFALNSPEQIEVSGLRYVAQAGVLERFLPDAERSVFRVPVDQRRAQLEQIPWVERAAVQRVMPNRLRVEITERRPVAFLRQGAELALVDASGVILDRPLEGEFNFPVVTGLFEGMPLDDRGQRMGLFLEFMREIEVARPGASAWVSEVDLREAGDVRVTLAGMPELGEGEAAQPAVLVHFGDADFQSKFRVFVENIGLWRASAGRVESVDLRFDRQVVVNPEQSPAAAKQP